MKKFVVVIIMVIVSLLGIIKYNEKDNNPDNINYAILYTSYQIEYGDTLSEISHDLYYSDKCVNYLKWDSYKDLMKDIMIINRLEETTIHVDAYITIPYCVEMKTLDK